MRKKTPSFIAEFPLSTTQGQQRELSIRLEAARQIYNACLGESLRRLDLMRESKAWQSAQAMPKHSAQAGAFTAVREKFEFNSSSIQKFGEKCRNGCWIGDHLGSHDTQTTTLRAFRAVEQYAFGRRGRPRFKRFNELESIEGKGDAVIRCKADPIPAVHYRGLVIPLVLDPNDKNGWQQEALRPRVKYTRILPARSARKNALVRANRHGRLASNQRPSRRRRSSRSGYWSLNHCEFFTGAGQARTFLPDSHAALEGTAQN